MFAMDILMSPGATRFSDGGIVKRRSNVSGISVILSLVTGTLNVVLLVPAVKVAVIGVEV